MTTGVTPMTIGDVKGVDVAGLMIDAGPVNSPVLMNVGTPNCARKSDPSTTRPPLQDVFFRIGGPHVGKARQSGGQQRQRHPGRHLGLAGRPRQRAWAGHQHRPTPVWSSTATTSPPRPFRRALPEVQRDLERRERRTIFFQNEMPYDPPNQAAWHTTASSATPPTRWPTRSRSTRPGGGGSYIFANVAPIHATARLRGPGHRGRAARHPHRLPQRLGTHRPRGQQHRRRSQLD